MYEASFGLRDVPVSTIGRWQIVGYKIDVERDPDRCWYVTHRDDWSPGSFAMRDWLTRIGLADVPFRTRREAVRAVQTAIATSPPATSSA